MITRHHFEYLGPDDVWYSACSFRGWGHGDGEFADESRIRRFHELAADQPVTCKTCLKNQKLKTLLEELSPWPDPSLHKERMAALIKPIKSVKITPEYRQQLRELYRRAPR